MIATTPSRISTVPPLLLRFQIGRQINRGIKKNKNKKKFKKEKKKTLFFYVCMCGCECLCVRVDVCIGVPPPLSPGLDLSSLYTKVKKCKEERAL